jgi:hypothetical protein
VRVSGDDRHLQEEAGVEAVRLDDQRRAAWTQDAAVLEEGAFRRSHVVQGVLRMDEVEGGVLERQLLGICDLEPETGCVLPCG